MVLPSIPFPEITMTIKYDSGWLVINILISFLLPAYTIVFSFMFETELL